MARTKEFEIEKLKAAAYFIFAESNESPNVENIAKQAKMKRTQLQNHYKFEGLRLLALEYAVDILTSNIFKAFKADDGSFELKIKMLVLHCMTKAKKHPNLFSFINKEYGLLETETLKRLRHNARLNLQPFANELEKQVEQGNFIDTDVLQVLMYIMSLSSYPIIAQHAIEIATGTRPTKYKDVLAEQTDKIVEFIIKGFKK